jgi:hypothetical protein
MGISVFPAVSGGVNLLKGWTVGLAGTFTLSTVLDAGVYRMSMDTSQNLTFSFSNTDAPYNVFPAFSGSTRGGSGWVSLPYPINRITVPAGTFPYSITLEKMDITPPAPPTNHSITWNANKTQVTGTWDTVSADATTVTFHWRIGDVSYQSNFSSTASGATATIPAGQAGPENALGVTYGLVCRNSSGASGLIATGVTGPIPSAVVVEQFTASGTWTSPITGTLTDMLVVGGGGNGAGGGGNNSGGAGGAGGYRTSTSQAVTAGTVYTITVGGAGSLSSFNGTFTAAGGGNGGNAGGGGGAGGSGGGGSGNGSTLSGAGGAGNTPATSPSQGNNGGAAGSTEGSGGGGGAGGAGGAGFSFGGGGGGSGVFNSITGTSIEYARGGTGGAGVGATGPGFGGGGRNYGQTVAGTGSAGRVILKYTF